jgi:hypothetical protein
MLQSRKALEEQVSDGKLSPSAPSHHGRGETEPKAKTDMRTEAHTWGWLCGLPAL